MSITFAQYCILTATYSCATANDIQRKTTLERLMINYYLMGLLRMGLVEIVFNKGNETTCYELTELGAIYVEDYERANSELVIRRTAYETRFR